jgi:hypothetical protein
MSIYKRFSSAFSSIIFTLTLHAQEGYFPLPYGQMVPAMVMHPVPMAHGYYPAMGMFPAPMVPHGFYPQHGPYNYAQPSFRLEQYQPYPLQNYPAQDGKSFIRIADQQLNLNLPWDCTRYDNGSGETLNQMLETDGQLLFFNARNLLRHVATIRNIESIRDTIQFFRIRKPNVVEKITDEETRKQILTALQSIEAFEPQNQNRIIESRKISRSILSLDTMSAADTAIDTSEKVTATIVEAPAELVIPLSLLVSHRSSPEITTAEVVEPQNQSATPPSLENTTIEEANALAPCLTIALSSAAEITEIVDAVKTLDTMTAQSDLPQADQDMIDEDSENDAIVTAANTHENASMKKMKKKKKKKKTKKEDREKAVLAEAEMQAQAERLAIIAQVHIAFQTIQMNPKNSQEIATIINDIESNPLKYHLKDTLTEEDERKEYIKKLRKLISKLPKDKISKVLKVLELEPVEFFESLVASLRLAGSADVGEVKNAIKAVIDEQRRGHAVSISIPEENQESALQFLIVNADRLELEEINFLLKSLLIQYKQINSVKALQVKLLEIFPSEKELIGKIDRMLKTLLIQKNQKEFLEEPSMETFIPLYKECSTMSSFLTSLNYIAPFAIFLCPLPIELTQPMTADKKAECLMTVEYIENHFKESSRLQLRDVAIWLTMPIVRKFLSFPVDIESLKGTLVEKISCLEITELSDNDIKELRERLYHINNLNHEYQELKELEPVISQSLLPSFRRLQAGPVREESRINIDNICNILELMNPDHTPEEKEKLVERSIISINQNPKLDLLTKNLLSLFLLQRAVLNKLIPTEKYQIIFNRLKREVGKLKLATGMITNESMDFAMIPLFDMNTQFSNFKISRTKESLYNYDANVFLSSPELQRTLLNISEKPLAESDYSDSFEILFYLHNIVNSKPYKRVNDSDDIHKTLIRVFHNLPLQIQTFGLIFAYDVFNHRGFTIKKPQIDNV